MNTVRFFVDKNCFEACDLIDVKDRPVEAKPFKLQMFPVDIGNGQDAWYGCLQSMSDGEKRYFKGWSGLVSNLQGILTPFAQLEVLRILCANASNRLPRGL